VPKLGPLNFAFGFCLTVRAKKRCTSKMNRPALPET
jgi:hypothetical protein